MEFLIADTFVRSLDRLTADERKAVEVSAFELEMNPVGNGLQCHRIEHSHDKHFGSARVSRDLRMILHRTDASVMLCYAGHHDDAYDWAQRRKLGTHPDTGAAHLVSIE